MGFQNCQIANWASWGLLEKEIEGRKQKGDDAQKEHGNMEGKENQRKRGREPEVSLEVPRFNAFSILVVSADGCIKL